MKILKSIFFTACIFTNFCFLSTNGMNEQIEMEPIEQSTSFYDLDPELKALIAEHLADGNVKGSLQNFINFSEVDKATHNAMKDPRLGKPILETLIKKNNKRSVMPLAVFRVLSESYDPKIKQSYKKYVKFLIENNIELNEILSVEGISLMSYLLSLDDNDEFLKLIAKKGFQVIGNARDKKGESPLSVAIVNKQPAKVKLLLEAGANPNLPSNDKELVTPLMIATDLDNHTIMRLLIQYGAHPDVRSADGATALFFAHNVATQKVLLEMGANPNIKTTDDGSTILMHVISFDAINKRRFGSISNYFYNKLPSIECNKIAALVKQLIAFNAEVTLASDSGVTPLHIAAIRPCIAIIDLLLDRGADINVQDKHGQTPLMLAIEANDQHIINYLLNKGSDINLRNKKGNSILAYAVFKENNALVEELLKRKMNPNQMLSIGREQIRKVWLIDYAKEKGYTRIEKLLQHYGA